MHRPQVSDPAFVGDWVREKKLGAGGFGVVTLWKNAKTDERVAVKQCHPPVASDQHADDIKRRWHLEVNFMTEKVSHDNIVRGVRVEPATFLAELERLQPTRMPVLLMEYCEGGDLRRLLNTSDYATGFPETEARSVLRSLGRAIEYLHTHKITHRDIKPENIVVKRGGDGRPVYKLTDLGYAKTLDHQTLVASLVGTPEYVAPEVFLTDRYTCSVDYWSLGVIAYELCTGQRPFASHLTLPRWMEAVKKKSSVHIAISEGQADGSIRYESALPTEHRLSEALAALLEPWLRLALEWHPKQRGNMLKPSSSSASGAAPAGNPADQLPPKLELRIFTQLRSVLDRRILRVFCLHTYRPYSVELNGEMATLRALIMWISQVTQIPFEQVNPVLPVAHPWDGTLSMDTLCSQLWWPDHDDTPMLYVSRLDNTTQTAAAVRAAPAYANEMPLPETVREVLAEPHLKWRPHVVRRFATAAYHVCRREQQRYGEALRGWYSLALRLDHTVQLTQPSVEQLLRLVHQLDGSVRMCGDTVRLMAAAAATSATTAAAAPPAEPAELTSVRAELHQLTERTSSVMVACERIAKRYKSVQRRSQEGRQRKLLERRDGAGDWLDIERMAKTLEILRIQLQQKAAVQLQLREMVHSVEQCRQRRSDLLHDKEWIKLQEFPAMEFEILEIKKAIDMAMPCVKQYQQEVLTFNSKLFQIVVVQASVAVAAAQNTYLPAIAGIGTEATAVTPTSTAGNGVKFEIGQAVSMRPTIATPETSTATMQRSSMSANKSVLLLSEVKTSTLISSNEEILSQMESMMQQMNSEFLSDHHTT